MSFIILLQVQYIWTCIHETKIIYNFEDHPTNIVIWFQCGCFESFPFRQHFVIFVRQITWFRWNARHWTSGVNVHNINSNRYVEQTLMIILFCKSTLVRLTSWYSSFNILFVTFLTKCVLNGPHDNLVTKKNYALYLFTICLSWFYFNVK
jgi:hypothetical protein